jgi:hypothetical protein
MNLRGAWWQKSGDAVSKQAGVARRLVAVAAPSCDVCPFDSYTCKAMSKIRHSTRSGSRDALSRPKQIILELRDSELSFASPGRTGHHARFRVVRTFRDRIFSPKEQLRLQRRWSALSRMEVVRVTGNTIDIDYELLALKVAAYLDCVSDRHRGSALADDCEGAALHLLSHRRRLDRLTLYIIRAFNVACDLTSTLQFLVDALCFRAAAPALRAEVESATERLLCLANEFGWAYERLGAVVTRTPHCNNDTRVLQRLQAGFNERCPREFRVKTEYHCAHTTAIGFILQITRRVLAGTLLEPFHPLLFMKLMHEWQFVSPNWFTGSRRRILERLSAERSAILASATSASERQTVSLPTMTARQLDIVRELHGRAPELVTQKELPARIKASLGVVQRDLTHLEKCGVVHRPRGSRSGYQLIDDIRELISASPSLLRAS